MSFIADLHIHSHFSRATSKNLDPEHLALWGRQKGISVIGSGDITHPGWIKELQEKLIEAEPGLFSLKPDLKRMIDADLPRSCSGKLRFMLSGEISCIYKKNGKTRKIHHLILMPDMESAIRLNKRLEKIGNIHSDGRPILGFDSRDLLEVILEASPDAFFIPAHIWTPWFSLFGSKSGFDSIEECFEDLTGHIHALETGLSSDPPMIRCISALDNYLLVSNSDAHSPAKLGREANIFDTEMDYPHMIQAMTDGKGFLGTIEFFPEEGKYHMDGHRKCGVCFRPTETLDHHGLCPECGKPVTVGVCHRIDKLADRMTPILKEDFYSFIPLAEILSEILHCGPATKTVSTAYNKLLIELGPELQILKDTPVSDIKRIGGPFLATAISRMRKNQVIKQPGYDGEYGKISLFETNEMESLSGQMSLFGTPVKKRLRRSGSARTKKTPEKKSIDSSPLKQSAPKDAILAPLNQEQQEAVLYEGKNLLVVAGPGTGKTLTLTHRITYLINHGLAAESQILALTFTRKAALEMRHRILDLLNKKDDFRGQVSTFHQFCFLILKNELDPAAFPGNFALCSEIDRKIIIDKVIKESGHGKRAGRSFLKSAAAYKQASVLNGEAPEIKEEHLLLLEKYREQLRKLGMFDLDDLEVEALRLFQTYPELAITYSQKYPWVFVDEYQDCNSIQAEIIKILIQAGQGNITAIGDPDQAIYGFRGADIFAFNHFNLDFPEAHEIILKRNYRSEAAILKGSAALMNKVKPLKCEVPGKTPVSIYSCRSVAEEAEMIVEQIEKLLGGTSHFSLDSGRVASCEKEYTIGFDDIAVLFRLNSQGDSIKKALQRAGIPFTRSGAAPLILSYPVNIIWRYLQTKNNPDNPFFEQTYTDLLIDYELKVPVNHEPLPASISDIPDFVINQHQMEISSPEAEAALYKLIQVTDDFKGDISSFLHFLTLERGIDHGTLMGDRVSLMSLHSAKGLEWPVVFITGCENQLLPCSIFGKTDNNEERRLFYVGMTRARKHLTLSHCKKRVINGRVFDMEPSPFISDIPRNICHHLSRRKCKPKQKAYSQMNLFS